MSLRSVSEKATLASANVIGWLVIATVALVALGWVLAVLTT